MLSAPVKRNAFRVFLLLHFVGLTLSIGGRFADFVIQGAGDERNLQTLAWSQSLMGALAERIIAPGFWLMIVSGVAMTALRYGRQPPIWVWIKVGLNATGILVASATVAPALTAARHLAAWSVQNGRLAPAFDEAAARAALFGGIVFTLFLLNMPVAVWKPFSKVKAPRIGFGRARSRAADTVQAA